MTGLALRIENLGKRYRIGQAQHRHDTLREAISELGLRLSGAARQNRESGTIWALRDVSFDVQRGDVVGIIGRNGAGKSTLLKILSRITEPTEGRAEIHGRVGSLLEVGTGFHPELTGRENIYLNGAILGMKKAEIDRQFDEIVTFAEIDRFLDTPVKRYSSGMYVRLAFAVAAHLEPEILLVDEVLAVGDIEFQRKCLGKIHNVTKQGRTVLFVSHNMAVIKSLCRRAFLLQDGRVADEGNVDQVVDTYLQAGSEVSAHGTIREGAPRLGTGEGHLCSIQLTNALGEIATQLYLGEPLRIHLVLELYRTVQDLMIEVNVTTVDGVPILQSFSTDGGARPLHLPPGRYRICTEISAVLLPRQYSFSLGLHHHANGATIDFVERVLDLHVQRVAAGGADHYRWPNSRGYVRPCAHWHPPETL